MMSRMDDLENALTEARDRVAELEGKLAELKAMPLYVGIALDDGYTDTPVSVVGVHPLRWRGIYPDTPPTHGFYRYDWEQDDE